MIARVIHSSDIFKAHYLRRRKKGLPHKGVVLVSAHKLIRITYAMQTLPTSFCPQANLLELTVICNVPPSFSVLQVHTFSQFCMAFG